MRQMKLGAKFLAGGLLLLGIPIALIGVITVYESSSHIDEITRNDLANVAQGLAGSVEINMNEQLISVRNIASFRSVVGVAEKAARYGLKDSQKEIALVEGELARVKGNEGVRCASVNVCGPDLAIIASSNSANRGVDISGRDYAQRAMKGEANIGSVVVSMVTGKIVSTAVSPIYASDGKAVSGIVMMAMEIDNLTDIVDRVRIGATGYAAIVQKNGVMIALPDKASIMKEDINKMAGMEALARMVAQGQSGLVEYSRNGIAKVGSVAAVPLTGWSVFSAIERADLLSPATALRDTIIAIALISLLLASAFLYLFSRSLTAPLNAIVKAAQAIAEGNISIELSLASRRDEMGSLSRAFALMLASLREKARIAGKIAQGDLTVEAAPLSADDVLGNAFSAMVARLRTHMSGINEGFGVLTAAGGEILAATTQVVAGTTETVAAITETTATVEEVRQAARLSSEKAKNVSSNAQKVTQASQSGQTAVDDTTAAMLRIRSQMESIAGTIVRLSEQNQSIGGIIASVTDLADQSNLLAVNAAIEAARAGDQGKGFTVIALEIKSLAEQSKKATAQIREILGEVQKATGAAVMATEQGTKAVEAGVSLSAQAGEAIRVLAATSNEATQAATQIVASSQQQVIGMDQIGIAMTNISQAGAQTAASMRQAEAAARNLHELGQKLKGLVDQYKT